MVAVYSYRIWDPRVGGHATPPVKATSEFITKANGEIVPVSVEDVEPSSLDEHGRFDP